MESGDPNLNTEREIVDHLFLEGGIEKLKQECFEPDELKILSDLEQSIEIDDTHSIFANMSILLLKFGSQGRDQTRRSLKSEALRICVREVGDETDIKLFELLSENKTLHMLVDVLKQKGLTENVDKDTRGNN